MEFTNREGAIVSAFTGFLMGAWSEYHSYVEELFGRPVTPAEICDPDFRKELREKARPDYTAICDTLYGEWLNSEKCKKEIEACLKKVDDIFKEV